MSQITVKDGNNQNVTVEAPLPPGQGTMATSKPVVIASDQSAVPVSNAAFGTTGQGAIVDPAGSGTFIQLLKGVLARLRWLKPGNLVTVTPDDNADLPAVVQALRVYATTDAVIKVTPADAADDAPVTINFPPGLTIEPVAVKRVWQQAMSGSPTIHGYV